MKLKTLIITTGLLSFSAAIHADSLSLTAGGGMWNATPSGTFKKITDPATVDLKDNLFFDTESQGYAFVTLEHFVPIIPNVRLQYTNLDYAGNGTSAFTFNGQTFSGNVVSDINMKALDLIAYYEVLDNVVSLDLGVNVRQLDVDYTIKSTSGGVVTTTSDSLSQTIPMLYALVGASPWPDVLLSAEISYVTYSGSTLSDITAKISYTTDFFVGIEAGYRSLKLELSDVDNTDADVTFDGPFAGAYLKF